MRPRALRGCVPVPDPPWRCHAESVPEPPRLALNRPERTRVSGQAPRGGHFPDRPQRACKAGARPADYPTVNPYASAQQAYTASAVMTASPEQLVVMLYDGAIRFLGQGAAAMRDGDRERARDRTSRVEAIIDELNLSLDMSQGEVSDRLRSIYLFCKRQLMEATIHSDPEKIAVVHRLLVPLRDAWDQACRAPRTEAA
jgi:flagellar protein FliS